MNIKKFFTLFALLISYLFTTANEGMWLPILLKKYNIEEMQAQGFKLTAEDIYDINQASLKDAVVGLVRTSNPFHHFCTGEVISNQGLVLTNHHCGYAAIQNHSSLENDYLTNGFWAMNLNEELANDGMGMSFLKRMEDVTTRVLKNIDPQSSLEIRDSIINANIKQIEDEAIQNTHFVAKVKPFFGGNEYYLSVYEIFTDIRLVGAPPSAIGKFGGDTDNWMWPRHTGDFSLFRIYADTNNNPATYSEKNIPYTPLKHLQIAIDGVQKGDFTMVMGYPGTTTEYLPAVAVTMETEVLNPVRIKIRTHALDIMKTAMNNNPKVRIQYASKAASLANSWKKWIGENKGLKRMNAVEKKKKIESDFTQWVIQNETRKKEYEDVLANYEALYTKITPYEMVATYMFETILNAELVEFSGNFNKLKKIAKDTDKQKQKIALDAIKSSAESLYKDYNYQTDKLLFEALISFYYREVNPEYHPSIFKNIETKYNGDISLFTESLYSKSMLPYADKTYAFITNYKPKDNKKLFSDPLIQLYNETVEIYRGKIYPQLAQADKELSELNRLYIKGLREFYTDKTLFPDANSTFRIAYGQIDNYEPKDAVVYDHFTTLQGLIEKDDPDIYDYDVPEKLKTLYKNADYGKYANADGSMPVCFTASNHTTGGNSGSPILNAKGQLIGINFDRNWEGTMSDIMYDPEMCRNIALDIRYVLFIIDKFADATHLVNEMTLVNAKPKRETIIEKEPLKSK